MNRKFDQCVSQKDVTLYNVVMSCHCDIVTSDTSGLYDYPFNLLLLTGYGNQKNPRISPDTC